MFIIAQAADDGLSLGRILRDIPHDTAAIIVYIMIAVFAGFIWAGSRKKSAGS